MIQSFGVLRDFYRKIEVEVGGFGGGIIEFIWNLIKKEIFTFLSKP